MSAYYSLFFFPPHLGVFFFVSVAAVCSMCACNLFYACQLKGLEWQGNVGDYYLHGLCSFFVLLVASGIVSFPRSAVVFFFF